MVYSIYLAGVFVLLLAAMIFETSMLPTFSISINFSDIINFLDIWAAVVVLAFCLLALLCTKSLKPLKNAIVFMFRKQEHSASWLEECLLAVKTAVLAALTGGGVNFTANIINMLKSMSLSGGAASAGADISTAMLSLAYPLVVGLVLLPVHAALKRELSRKNSTEKSQHVISVHRRKKAG